MWVWPSRACLLTRNWWWAWAATWGRWVTHRTWRSAPRLAQQAPDDLRHAAADADVHLVEDQAGDPAALGRGHLDGEPDAGEFAAGGDLRQGCRG